MRIESAMLFGILPMVTSFQKAIVWLLKYNPFELIRLECNVNTGKTQLFRGVTTHSDDVGLPLLKFKIHGLNFSVLHKFIPCILAVLPV